MPEGSEGICRKSPRVLLECPLIRDDGREGGVKRRKLVHPARILAAMTGDDMTARKVVALVTAISVAFLATGCSASDDVTVSTYVEGWASSQAVPLPTEEGLVDDMTDAYAFGGEVADGLPGAGERFGYKFGCGAAVCPFAEHIPLVGTLWSPMVRSNGAAIDQEEWVRGFVEGELAFRLAGDITEPVTGEDMRNLVSAVAPSAELPDFAFGSRALDETPILDVIADNGIARGLVVGEFRPVGDLDVDTVALRGTRGGELVLSGGAKDVTDGSHWDALALAVGLLLDNGRSVQAGDVIITGTMGDPTPMESGDYVLDFGPLGAVDFTVG
jgi:2-keto-4-pentenoate hydratase